MLAGVRSITRKESAEIYSREFVCSQKLREAMDEQLQIGWSHFLQGRISSKWKEVGPNEAYKKGGEEWSTTVVGYCITIGLRLWTERNRLIHGNDGETSKLEIAKTNEYVKLIYSELYPNIHPSHRWLFSTSLDNRIQESYAAKVAWLDSVRRLYPEQSKEYRSIVDAKSFRRQDIEYNKVSRLRVTDI